MALTKEQALAVEIEPHTNILVSAGAGSGKTAVLSKRVLRKVSDGFTVKRLLLLTFTKDAAKEMKDRVRKVLIENNFLEEAKYVDEAYITTFDSFSLSLLKKYHYALNISNNIEICDSTLLDIIKRKSLDKALDIEYQKDLKDFENLITNMSLKGDDDFKGNVLNILSKLDLMSDRDEYLKSYISAFYNIENLTKYKDKYISLVYDLFKKYKSLLEELENHLSGKTLDKLLEAFKNINTVKTYSDIKTFFESLSFKAYKFPVDAKKIYDDMGSVKKEIEKLTSNYPKEEYMIEDIMKTKPDAEALIRIITNTYKFYDEERKKKSLYDFSDISIMVINLLKENESIREDVKKSFDEIMVDEYQDTSDIEEELLDLISNNNLYMVGDVKQSIYRFRNANPNIFREKYKKYSKKDGGIKIDLNKNFRSREEVLNNINKVFDLVMNEEIGGSNYKEDGEAVFGNTTYNDYKEGEYNLDILTYDEDKTKEYTNTEKEIFIIADDIKKRVNEGKMIFDKDENKFRKISYKDFVVLLSKKKDFDLYKKIFEYLGIPITIYREENINNTPFIYVIHNIYKFISDISNNIFDENTKYAFLSIARSFLSNLTDEEILKIFKENNFKETDIYNKGISLKNDFINLSPKEFYLKVLDVFDINYNILKTEMIDEKEKSIYYLFDVIDSLEKKEYNNNSVLKYLDETIKNGYKMSYDKTLEDIDSVKIMSIHKSKGLEFPVCYFGSMSDGANREDSRRKIAFDRKYGFMIPIFNYGYKSLITRILYDREEKLEDIGEKIRLLYVALTRSREKIVIVMKNGEGENYSELVPDSVRSKYSSFYLMLNSILGNLEEYITLKEPNLTKNYIISQKENNINKSNIKLDVKEIKLNNKKEEEKHFSKEELKIETKDEKNLLELGTKCHKILEEIDFENPDFTLFNINDYIKDKINKFINSDIINKIKTGKIYKEYEFIYEENSVKYHGIIDLMIEYDNVLYIFDYKLKGIDDQHYDDQLNGYRKYIESLTHKKVYTYLYSILDSKIREVK